MWSWCMWSAYHRQTLLWVHISRTTSSDIVAFSGGSFQTFNTSLADVNSEFFGMFDAPTLVVDGATNNCKNIVGGACSWWKRKRESRRLILVSSLQFGWAGEDYQQFNMDEVTLPGWTVLEYQTACKDTSFCAQVIANLMPLQQQ